MWNNYNGEVVFCSRKEPLMEEFGDVLDKGGFKEQASISYGEEGNLKRTFVLPILCKT